MLCTEASRLVCSVLVLQAALTAAVAALSGLVAGEQALGAALLAGALTLCATLAYAAVWRGVAWVAGEGAGAMLLAHLSGEAAKIAVAIGGLLWCLARFGNELPMLPFLAAFVAGLSAYLLALGMSSVRTRSTQ